MTGAIAKQICRCRIDAQSLGQIEAAIELTRIPDHGLTRDQTEQGDQGNL